MNRRVKGFCVALLAVMIWGSLGCDSRARQTGEEGNLQFFYNPADDSSRFDRPLAAGSEMLLFAEPLRGRELDEIIAVEVGSESIMSAEVAREERDPPAILLRGKSAGETTVMVRARGDGETYMDSITLEVSRVEQVELAHLCTSSRDAAYVMEHDLLLKMERQNRRGDALVGSARSSEDLVGSCQVEMNPAFFQDKAHCDEVGLHFPAHIFTELETFSLSVIPEVDTLGSSHRVTNVHIIHPDEIFFEGVQGELQVESNRNIQLNPRSYHEDFPVCMNLWMEVSVLTPDLCTGENGALDFEVEPSDENQFRMRGVREGYCEFEVVFPQIDHHPWVFETYVDRR